jgi:transcriptional regulator with PAS, ATPase and Fis domain
MPALFSWLGRTDLDKMKESAPAAIASLALKHPTPFDQIIVLANTWEGEWDSFKAKLSFMLDRAGRSCSEIRIVNAQIKSPIDYTSINIEAERWINKLSTGNDSVAINLTSGTPAMIVMTVLIAKGKSNTEFFQVTPDNKLITVDIPLDFGKEYVRSASKSVAAKAANSPVVKKSFDDIATQSEVMQLVISQAKRLAKTDVPVLVLGETGTGKELMANAIHSASMRADKPIRTVNCGALPETLVDSILFGHVKGAFTGANTEHKGLFEQANQGTLFLDELGELSADIQVKLLRALQQGEIQRVGDDKVINVDVRVIGATHRDLMKMVVDGEFREDLFYRLAVGIIKLPALRARTEDIPELVDSLVNDINETCSRHPDYESKKICDTAIKFIVSQPWQGNIRELWNTLNRAFITTESSLIEPDDIAEAMLYRQNKQEVSEVILSLGQQVNVEQIIDNTKKKYVKAALKACGNNYSKAASMLGFKSHQRLKDWMRKLDIEETK